jgi:diguanylate cyclase (GGDEF)-like protein/PAS domain S-box-containing protein
MYRARQNGTFIWLALALLVSGVVAGLSNAGLLGQVDAAVAAARAAVLEVAGLSHDRLTDAAPWQIVMAALTLFAIIMALSFRRLSWPASIAAGASIVFGLVLLSATAAWYAAIDLPVAPFAVVVLCFASFPCIAGLRRQFGRTRTRRPMDAVVRHIIEHRILGIVMIDGSGLIGSMNPAAQVMLGYGASALSGTHVRHLLPRLFKGGDEGRTIEAVLNVDGGAFETRAVQQGGAYIPVEVTVTRLPVEGGAQYSAFVRDLTVFRNQQRVLEHQALHDSLTGLPNRTLFMRRLEDAIEAAGPRRRKTGVAVLLLDLDRFKEVNNTLGHAVGDRALQELAERLAATLPENATLARLGGDEFAVLLSSGMDASKAEAMAGRLRTTLEASLDVDSIRLDLDGSVGIALWPHHADTSAELMQRADVAMYAAKQTPMRIALYDAAQDESSLRRLTLSGDLRRAIKNGQLFLQYQPKVDLKTKRLSGVEALVRWRHPEYGAVSPDDFIEHAELTGVIVPLSEWVLTTAVERCASWRANGLDIDVAVNLSARLLLYPEIVDLVEAALKRVELPAERLILEVTESTLMADPKRAQDTLAALKKLGVRLAIDDYGTGYSSLAYLSDLNADELKIDKRFVLDAVNNTSDRAIVESTISLAHNLGLKVVAEGVEDERAYRLLRRLGCETGQGYFFAKPLADRDIVAWAESRTGGRTAGRAKPRKASRPARGKRAVGGRGAIAATR